MGFIFNKFSVIMGVMGLLEGYLVREGFCLFNCINDTFTVKTMIYFSLGLFLAGILYNFLYKDYSFERRGE